MLQGLVGLGFGKEKDGRAKDFNKRAVSGPWAQRATRWQPTGRLERREGEAGVGKRSDLLMELKGLLL